MSGWVPLLVIVVAIPAALGLWYVLGVWAIRRGLTITIHWKPKEKTP